MKLDDLRNYDFTNNEKVLLTELNYYVGSVDINDLKRKFICDKKDIEKLVFNLSKKGFIELLENNMVRLKH